MKRVFRFLAIITLVVVSALAGYFLLDTKSTQRDILAFVPSDFVYAIQSDQPIKDWQDLSNSKVWRYLKQTPYFSEVSESADYLDSVLVANKTIARFVKLGDMIISAHMVSTASYEFIYLIDLKGAKLSKLRDAFTLLFQSFEYDVYVDQFYGYDIFELYEPKDQSTLYMSFVDNVLVASYNRNLLEAAIQQSERPSIQENPDFTSVHEQTNRDDLYTLYVNFSVFEQLLAAFTNEIPQNLQDLHKILAFSTFDINLKDDRTVMKGYMKQIDTIPSFFSVFKDVGKGRLRAQNVLPPQTALYTSIGFDQFMDFYRRLEEYYELQDPEAYEDIIKQKSFLEKRLKIDFEDDFFSWMTDEIATAIIPIDSQQTEFAYYALFHFDHYDKAKDHLDFVTERIRKTFISPVKFTSMDYRGFEIRYMELKGFFKLFFQKFFSRIEQPHYTFLDDYVVFSNDTTSLQFLIEAYLDQDLLVRDDDYRKFIRNFDSQSNIYTYLRNEQLYPFLYQSLDMEAKSDLEPYKEYLMSFPQVGFQVTPSYGMYRTFLMAEFAPLEDQPTQ